MVDINRLVSAVLLMLGVLLVFLGMSSALGLTPGGMVASVAAIAALLYAGAIWFAPVSDPAALSAATPIVFDRNRVMVTGPAPGQTLVAAFSEDVRPELEQRCIAALNGVPGGFVAVYRGRATSFQVVPVRSADGVVVYGMIVTADALPSALAASA